ncbi:MAG: GAF domain-containing sensor histidine kinase [Candidatus Omnitrophica bacterium]|nr:GAF domain-containing sensor histidine kinase [Candidatus Omnitrophota bacterium]
MSLYLKKRKRFLKKILVGLTLFLLGTVIISILSLFFGHPLYASGRFDRPSFVLILMSLMAILIYKPIDAFYAHFFRHFLFKKKSYAHMVLMNLTGELATVLDLHELGNMIVNTFGEVLHLKTVVLLAHCPPQQTFDVVSGYGWNVSETKRVWLPYDSALIEIIRSTGPHVLVRDRVVRSLAWLDANRISHDFTQLHASWVIPLFVKSELVGALGFAAPSPESIFDEADFQFFREFSEAVAPSVRNARQFYELEQANKTLQDSQSALVQTTKMAAIEQLATGIAHEIHNPLTIISGKAQVLLLKKEKTGMSDQVEDVLKTIVQQTKRAADITRKLLMFSQGAGASREPLNLVQVLSDTLALVSYQTSLEGIRITSSSRGPVPVFVGNLHEMREVFLSLTLNAVQSLGSKGGKVHCEINYLDHESLIEILVLDSGPGISRENIHRLFNPFFTTRQDGVGLGLFVTKQIIHRYGGSIRAESRVGEGTLFMIQLPCTEAAVTKEETFSLSPSREMAQGQVPSTL